MSKGRVMFVMSGSCSTEVAFKFVSKNRSTLMTSSPCRLSSATKRLKADLKLAQNYRSFMFTFSGLNLVFSLLAILGNLLVI